MEEDDVSLRLYLVGGLHPDERIRLEDRLEEEAALRKRLEHIRQELTSTGVLDEG